MLGSNPSADSGAKTEAGYRRCPVWFSKLRDWHKAINAIKECSLSLVRFGWLHSCSPASRSAFQDMAMMEESVQHRGDGGSVAEQLAPIFDRAV